MKRIFFICLTILIICQEGRAQGFKEGYYISKDSDTIPGFITGSLKNDNRLIKFKNNIYEEPRIISIDTIISFVYGKVEYVSWYGKRRMTHPDKIDFTIKNFDSSSKEEWIPLQTLLKGKLISLYFYEDIKEHFFAGNGSEIQELMITYRDPQEAEKYKPQRQMPTYITLPVFRQQLHRTLQGNLSEKLVSLLYITDYNKRSLLNFFKRVNR